MNAVSINHLEKISDILSSDQFHLLKKNDYGVWLSYKCAVSEFGDVFSKVSTIKELLEKIETSLEELNQLSSSMESKTHGDSTYIKTETIDAKTPALVTNTALASELSKYPKQETLNAKREELYAEARRLADEMTDFTGAAMVGINQSNASYQSSEEEGDDEKKKKD